MISLIRLKSAPLLGYSALSAVDC